MATTILAPQKSQNPSTGYKLPARDRQQIISQTPLFKRSQKIERQRQGFIKKFGADGL